MLAKLANFQRVSLQIQNVDSRSITQLLQNLPKDLIISQSQGLISL